MKKIWAKLRDVNGFWGYKQQNPWALN